MQRKVQNPDRQECRVQSAAEFRRSGCSSCSSRLAHLSLSLSLQPGRPFARRVLSSTWAKGVRAILAHHPQFLGLHFSQFQQLGRHLVVGRRFVQTRSSFLPGYFGFYFFASRALRGRCTLAAARPEERFCSRFPRKSALDERWKSISMLLYARLVLM